MPAFRGLAAFAAGTPLDRQRSYHAGWLTVVATLVDGLDVVTMATPNAVPRR
jgi:hypothetical protein